MRNLWLTCFLMACGSPTNTPSTAPDPAPTQPAIPASESETDAAAVVPTSPRGKPSADVLDRQMLFGNPVLANVQISPDGKYLSWTAPKDGVMNVFVASAAKPDDARAVTSDVKRPVRNYLWTHRKDTLLYLQDVGGDENFHIYRVTVDDGKVTDLTPESNVQARIIGVSHRKPNLVLVGLNDRDPNVHDVWSIDLGTGAKQRIVENEAEFADWLADDELAIRFASKVLPDGTTVLYQRDRRGRWNEYEKAAATDTLTPFSFTKRGDSLYITDDRERDTAALFVLDIKTKQKKLILEDARADISNVVFHPTENTPFAASVEWDRERWAVLDPGAQKDFAELAKLGEGDVWIASMTLDGKIWIVGLNGDRQPTRFYKWDRTKQEGTFLFATRPELEGKPLAKQHSVVIKARDGLDLVSYLTLPKSADQDEDGRADAPVPVVLLVHGGPWGRDSWGFNPLTQMLANRGYGVLSVNFRGSTGFGKAFLNAGNGEWGKAMHEDLLDATEWLVAQNIAPKDKICIMGGSYGGYATLAGLTLTPEVFTCGVDIVGPSSILTLVESIPPYWAPIVGVFKFRVGDWTKPEVREALLEVSPLTHAAKIERPLLIAQGANDPRVKQAESDQIVRAMQENHRPVSYVVFPDEGHGFARPENNLAFFAATEAFLSAQLGGVYQPISKAELEASSIQIVTGKEWIPGWP